MNRRDFINAAAALSGSACVGSAHAAQWPTQPFRIINAYPPGGIVDILARLVGAQMSHSLGQPVIVEDKAGAGGNIGTAYVARAKGDPYTLLLGASGPLAINVSLYPNLGYDPLRDFTPLTLIAATPLVLVTAAGSGVDSVQALLAKLRSAEKPPFYGSAGTGTPQHLAGELFKQKTDTKATHVPYKGGAPAVVAVIAGEVLYAFENLALVQPHIKAGKLRALAVTTSTRTAQLPDVPTVAESGVAGFEARGWYGLLAPAGLPDDIVRRLADEAVKAGKMPQVQQVIASFGSGDVVEGPQAFQKLIAAEIPKWQAIVKAGHISIEA